jgi:hypothetical protein
MKKIFLSGVFSLLFWLSIQAQTVYVDSNIGDDKNPGSKESPVYSIQKAAEIIRSNDNEIYVMKINPGIYVLDKHISVSTEKPMDNKRIVIEASVLPDDSTWSPEKMPVIINSSLKGEIPDADFSYVISFLINESHVCMRGLKFHGYVYPNTRYFPIARLNMEKTDLSVEQCMFIADKDASHIQVGVIAHGNEIKIDHCVFFNAKNTVVFWLDDGKTIKHGNGITNSIIYGAFQSAVWTASPDKDFKFENNVVTNCKHVWIRNYENTIKYSINNCVIVNNKYNKAIPGESGVEPADFEITENNVVKEGDISLRKADNIDDPLPIDYLHLTPGSAGYLLGAGLFKNKKLSK